MEGFKIILCNKSCLILATCVLVSKYSKLKTDNKKNKRTVITTKSICWTKTADNLGFPLGCADGNPSAQSRCERNHLQIFRDTLHQMPFWIAAFENFLSNS